MRWTMPGRATPPIPESCPRQWCSSALTSVPSRLPAAGCTTRPAGLSMTIRSASSNTPTSGISCATASALMASGTAMRQAAPSAGFIEACATGLPSSVMRPSSSSALTRSRERPEASASALSSRCPPSAIVPSMMRFCPPMPRIWEAPPRPASPRRAASGAVSQATAVRLRPLLRPSLPWFDPRVLCCAIQPSTTGAIELRQREPLKMP